MAWHTPVPWHCNVSPGFSGDFQENIHKELGVEETNQEILSIVPYPERGVLQKYSYDIVLMHYNNARS